MDITPYVESLRDDLANAAQLGGDEAREAATRLLLALDPSVRMTLLQALSDAAAEVTQQLDGAATVDVRLAGRDARIVVDRLAPPPPPAPPAPLVAPAGAEEDEGTARITLRLPESLKNAADERAAAENASLNTWLVGAVRAQLGDTTTPTTFRSRGRSNKRLTGWA